MMILIPYDFQISTIFILHGLFEVVEWLDVVAVKIVLHDVVDDLGLGFGEEVVDGVVLLYHDLDELL